MKLGGVYDPAQSISGGIMPNTAALPYAGLIVLAGLWGPAAPAQVLTGGDAYGDFTKDAPGVRRHIAPGDLPALRA